MPASPGIPRDRRGVAVSPVGVPAAGGTVRIDNRVLIGGVAVCAAVATFHGAAHAAGTSGVAFPIDLLYPVMGDGLALVAWRQTQDPGGRLRGFAWCVMVLAASASGLAQAYVLAQGKQGGSAVLAAGMGAAPAVCVLLATVLASGSSRLAELAEPEREPGREPGEPGDEPAEPDDELADRREMKDEPKAPETVECVSGCGRQVSRATYKRHKLNGCPAAAA